MSKFRNRIRDIGRAPGGFGFAAIAQRERPRHVLVVATAATAEEAATAVQRGADAIVLDAPLLLEGVGGPAVPVGALLEDATAADVAAAHRAGADFFVFDDARTHASALTHDEIGRVLVLGPDQQEERLRAVAGIDLDALLVEATPGMVTVRDQLEMRRVATLTGATLIVRCTEPPDAAALAGWRDAGAPMVLVPAALTELAVAAAAEVPAPVRRHRGGEVPVLGAQPVSQDYDDDDEDD